MSYFKKIIFMLLTIGLFVNVSANNDGLVKNPFEKNRDEVEKKYDYSESADMKEQVAQEAQKEDAVSEILHVHYADAAVLAQLVKSSGEFLSESGSIISEDRTNILWVKDVPEKLMALKSFLRQVDIPAKQVRIRARLVNVDQSSIKELGLKFGTTEEPVLSNGGEQLHMDLPLNIKDAGHFSVAVAKLGNNVLLNLELSALEKEGHAKTISNPELITAHRQAASIESGQEIPYQESTVSGATNVTFKKAVLSLKVTPTVTPENKILLNLVVNQDKVSQLMVNGVPAVSTQEVQTQVLVNNGETIVLGGIYEETTSTATERVPFLSSIPLVGVLFKSKNANVERRELLIFVQPEVI